MVKIEVISEIGLFMLSFPRLERRPFSFYKIDGFLGFELIPQW